MRDRQRSVKKKREGGKNREERSRTYVDERRRTKGR